MMLIAYILYVLLYIAFIGAILFVSAGRTDLPFFWAYLVLNAIPTLIATIVVYRHNPDELREQTKRNASNNTQDKLTIPLFLVAFLSHWIIAGLDVGRFHWSDTVPAILQIIGLIGFSIGFSLVAWSTIVNQFYSPSVRVQEERGQQVITAGPYGIVRHPGYIGWLLFFAFSGMALGSWLAVLPPLLPALAVIRRTMIEDKMLQESLNGYTDYAQKVRYRLIPGIW